MPSMLTRLALGLSATGWPGSLVNCVHRVHADIELHALGNQAVDVDAVRAVGAQQRYAGTERDDLDGNLVRAVELEQVVGDADTRPCFLRSASESCSTI